MSERGRSGEMCDIVAEGGSIRLQFTDGARLLLSPAEADALSTRLHQASLDAELQRKDSATPLFRRVIYVSKARAGSAGELARILRQSRQNNGIDGVTGLLWSDGSHYVQLLEGPVESVEGTLARISQDDRHEGMRLVSDTTQTGRAFADWSMADLSEDRSGAASNAFARALARAPDDVRDAFANAI